MTVAGPRRICTGFLHRHHLSRVTVACGVGGAPDQSSRYRISRELVVTTATNDALGIIAASTGDNAAQRPTGQLGDAANVTDCSDTRDVKSENSAQPRPVVLYSKRC
jgi:hypothetical protein